jgi:NAD(P)-dependent dehydrogenase (short-subunit alcohol dehydrogenase family)
VKSYTQIFQPKDSGKDPEKLTASLTQQFSVNVVGNIHLFNLFMPLVLKGAVKKVVTISSGMGDMELVRKYNISEDGPYSISKAAVSMAVAKFSAEYAKDGVLFLSISPGVVGTDVYADRKSSLLPKKDRMRKLTEQLVSDEDQQKLGIMSQKFAEYAPDFKGPITPEESVKAVLSVVEASSVANGDGGAFYSHLGKGKKWL